MTSWQTERQSYFRIYNISKDNIFSLPDVIKVKVNKALIPKQLHSTLDSVADEMEALEEVAAAYDLTKHNSFYVVQRKPLFQDVWIAGERVMFFRDTTGIVWKTTLFYKY